MLNSIRNQHVKAWWSDSAILRNMLNVETVGSVLYVTLDRPEVRNAFNDELIEALYQTFSNLDSTVRVVVLAGNGGAFCAGGDLNWMRKASSYTEEQNYQDAYRLACLFQAITKSQAVVIAKIRGAAFGGGCGLVAAADVAIASEDASFAFSEVRLGLVPATISPFVIQKIGAGHARALFTTGEMFRAEKALRIGLVHDVVRSEDLDDAVMAKIKLILSAGPLSVAESKRIAQGALMTPEESATVLASARAGDEGKEGVKAFLDKRSPNFKANP